jgi:O-antigen ligase
MLYAGLLFFLFLQFLRPQEFVPLIYGWPVVFYTMMALLPFWLVTLKWKKLLRTPQDLFMFLFWISCTASYWNWWKSHMYEAARDFGKILLCFLFVSHVINTRRKLVGVIWMVMLMLLVVALMAGRIEHGQTQGQYASIGVFNNRNDFAYAMAIMLPLAFAFILRGDPFSKIVGAGVALAGVVELIATRSRGGMLASLFAVYAVFFMLVKSKPARAVMAVVGVLVLMTAFALSPRLSTITEYQQDRSSMDRVYIWAQGLEMFRQHWLLGVGYNKFGEYCKRDSHSSYVRAMAELGGPGLFLYVGLLFFAMRDAYRITMRPPHPTIGVVALGMTGVLAGHIVGSLFQTRLYHPFVLVLIAIVAALRLVTERERWLQRHYAPAAAVPRLAGGPQLPLRDVHAFGLTPPPPPEDWAPDDSDAEPKSLWRRGFGSGFATPRMIPLRDWLIVGGLTFACWLAHKGFVMYSS